MNSLEQAKELLSGCLFISKDAISDDANISEIGELDSLRFEMIVMEIERITQRDADPVELLEMRSVKDLAALLEQ